MQQVRLWEITANRKLSEIPARFASLEEWIEDWLADDISVLDPSLLVIGRQVRTSFGGAIDLLCMDGEGSLVVRRTQERKDTKGRHLPDLGVFVVGQGLAIRRNIGYRNCLPGN